MYDDSRVRNPRLRALSSLGENVSTSTFEDLQIDFPAAQFWYIILQAPPSYMSTSDASGYCDRSFEVDRPPTLFEDYHMYYDSWDCFENLFITNINTIPGAPYYFNPERAPSDSPYDSPFYQNALMVEAGLLPPDRGDEDNIYLGRLSFSSFKHYELLRTLGNTLLFSRSRFRRLV